MRTFEEVKADVLASAAEFERYVNNPDDFVLDEYGRPTEFLANEDALIAELKEMYGEEAGIDIWVNLMVGVAIGSFPEPEENNS